MISTNNLTKLPGRETLQNTCKALAVLDAILCQEWEFRYYSYNHEWSENEEVFEMRNGEGDHMLILFRQEGCIINGFAHEYYDEEENPPSKEKLTKRLPTIFNEFIFGEPVKSIGTTYCIWTTGFENWQTGQIKNDDDGSEEMMSILDNNPQTYIHWATEYFEDSYKESGIPLETVNQIYNGKTLTKEMALSIVDELEDWQQLADDMKEINYPFNFD